MERKRTSLGVQIQLLICSCSQTCNKKAAQKKIESRKERRRLASVDFSWLQPHLRVFGNAAVAPKAINHAIDDCRESRSRAGGQPSTCAYLGVSVDLTRWDKELEEGVLLSCCSGVVSGPSMLTENTATVTATPTHTHTHAGANQKTDALMCLSGVE